MVSREFRKLLFSAVVEVRFIDQSDFVNKGNGFLLKGSPDWELDSTNSLEMTDLLDDISVY